MVQSKSTKKFEKKHLKDVLKRRKDVSKIKQKKQLTEKRKAQRAKDDERAEALDGNEPGQAKKTKDQRDKSQFESMTVDEFFQGGFDIPKRPNKKRKSAATPESRLPRKQKQKEPKDDGEVSSDEDLLQDGAFSEGSGDSSDSDDDLGDHKEQLKALAKEDPAFYKHLQQEEPELLEFDEGKGLAELDISSDSEDGADTDEKTSEKANIDRDDEAAFGVGNQVTINMVKKWETAMKEQNSLRSMREVVLAFRAAAHLNDDSEKAHKYAISNSDVYHDLLVLALNKVPDVLQHHLPVKEGAGGKIRLAIDSKKFRTLTPLLKSHASSVLHLLENLSDASTLRLTMSHLLALLPYLLSFKKIIRDLSRVVVAVWSDASNSEAVRISAFLVLRRLVVIGDPGIRDAVLKATYQGLVKGSRNTTVHTVSGINLMKNSAAELWGLDPNIGYTTGFTFIRQLAIHLRSSITNKTKESYKTVYNWQYVHSLDFWSRVVSAHCESLREAEAGQSSPLRPLIYPVVQLILGAMRLIPTAQYFPLRFQLIRSLLRISLATGTFIPVASSLYEVLTSNEMKKPPKASTLKALDFNTSIRAPKAYIHTRVYQDGVGEQVTELFSEFLVLWTKNIAFPELALPIIVMLKRWLKDVYNKNTGNKNGKINSSFKLLVDKIEANSRWVEARRSKVDFAPNDRAGVEGFLKDVEWEKTPLGAFVVGQRKTREERAKTLEQARREEDRKRGQEAGDAVEEGGFEEEEDESVSDDD